MVHAHSSSVSEVRVSTAAGPVGRRLPSNRNVSRRTSRDLDPFSLGAMDRIGESSSSLWERSSDFRERRWLIVSGRCFKALLPRFRFVKAVLSPRVSGTCRLAWCGNYHLRVENVESGATCT